jgi:alginate O-acetyltransferase complex protein AlgI
MLFNSLPFVLFLLVVLAVYYLALRSWRGEKLWLLAASWLFYASWSPGFLLLLVATTGVDFYLARWIHALRERRPGDVPGVIAGLGPRGLVAASVAMNLGVLGFFKYGRFLYAQAALVAPLPPLPAALAWAIPLGISFYTFHSISYIVDTYRGTRAPSERFTDFALYVAFFPQLVAGPITRWGFFGPQLERGRVPSAEAFESAGFLIAQGLIKKVVLADGLGAFIDPVYANVSGASTLDVAVALYGYAFQIYFDFSGYTDIALGLAQLLGLRLPENFRHPYLAESPREFWRRWHISLSTWLRDYLYIPLGGNRGGRVYGYVNLLVTMLLGGLWHGASWTFVVWGGLHGVWLAAHRALLDVRGRRPPRTPVWVRRVVTFHLVVVAWVFFRAPSLAVAASVFRGLASLRPPSGAFPLAPVAMILVGLGTHALAPTLRLEPAWRRLPRSVQGAAYGLLVILIGMFSVQGERFIYFQF